ncbi:hypothetical protein BBH99_20325 [Chryseobacterium contaminans]|uniref:Zinc-finger n=1 Tax=Chryseobacterium contaminans TaxID=1423959 RepID=A0A1M7B1T1_9FLAO|nr:hypothetical protein [Chryseobacterium contaminans]OCA78912.1 hypothetical protein BBH99_20325 [Chryseobacterium contaminans]SHL48609.1 hypothetical protein SAMN05444407_104191 [Chryseobacterium contaminans]
MIRKILHILFLPCSEATLLMEKRNAQTISAKERRRLNLHIAICKWCKAYNEKMKLLDKIFRKTFSEKDTEINEVEIQDFKNKMLDKLNF